METYEKSVLEYRDVRSAIKDLFCPLRILCVLCGLIPFYRKERKGFRKVSLSSSPPRYIHSKVSKGAL
jgi:hypothetical protein